MRISKLIQGAAAAPSRLPVRILTGRAPAGAASIPSAAVAAASSPSGLEGLLRGRTVGERYDILEVIGRGGMGVVYRALDHRLDREVAVKVLSAPAPDGESYARLRVRFAREARAVAAIRHGNVVAIHDQGTDAALGIDFLVMELLDGEDLGTRLRREGLPRLSSAVRLLREAAAGVAAGHRTGLVHRDIKPANLYLESSGGEVRVKVLDFGLAENAREPEWTMASSGGETLRALSPAFASPEQLRGDLPLTKASDVFSLGAVAHHLLTGERLWESIDPHRALQEMEAARTALLEDRSLPLKLREVVTQALASHPEDRFRDAGELLNALDAVRVSEDAAAEVDPQGIRTAVTPPPVAVDAFTPRAAARQSDLARAIQRLGAAFLLALAASICFLTLLSGEWNTLMAAIVVFGAAALLPAHSGFRPAGAGVRFAALAIATAVLLGVMLTRAALGSVSGLLFAQIIVTGIALWLTSRRHHGAAHAPTFPPARDSW